MELFKYYNLVEATNIKNIKSKLEELADSLKIEYKIQNEILTINDLDLEMDELESLLETFDNNSVLPDLDYSEDEDIDFLNLSGEDNSNDYYDF